MAVLLVLIWWNQLKIVAVRTIVLMKDLVKEPDLLFIIDIKTEKTALLEAAKKKIPVIALCDSNVNPDLVQYVIPGNDDAKKGVELIVMTIAEMVIEAQKKAVAAQETIANS